MTAVGDGDGDGDGVARSRRAPSERASLGSRAAQKVPAPLLFIGAGVSSYVGAALAVGLFAVAPALSVGWARLVVAALVLLALARPWRLRWTRRQLGGAALFGVLLGGMNVMFYVAIDHLALGAAVALEFAGPVAVAVVTYGGGWSWRRVVAPLLAAGGVVAIGLSEVDWSQLREGSGTGVLFALGAGATWAGYMVIGSRMAAHAAEAQAAGSSSAGGGAGEPDALRRGLASLSLGLATAALAFAVLGAPAAAPLVADARTVAMVVGVGVLSSVVPYALDQVSLGRLSTASFALLNALLPVTATVVGAVALQQLPTVGELAGVAGISIAVALSTRHP